MSTVPLSQVTPTIGSTESGLELGRKVVIVNEPGLYALIMRSRKESARTFRRWVVHEVLPAIRRTGRYAVDERPASDLPADMHAFLREVSQVATEAAVTAAREAAREASAGFREPLVETLEETRSAFKEAVAEMRDTFAETVREVTAVHAAHCRPSAPQPRPAAQREAEQPLWHLHIPRDALSFGESADLLSEEFGQKEITRAALLEVARDAGLLRRVPSPNAGDTLTDPRLQSLFRVRRLDGSRHGWSCAYRFQPVVLSDGLAILRQLIAQEIDRGTL
jgi:prophage antirepressor-like protein